jgi:hypothetical protein
VPDRPARSTGARPGSSGHPVRFGARVTLSKEEAFGACQALADAGRVLVRSGGRHEADSLCSLFELLEERLVRS